MKKYLQNIITLIPSISIKTDGTKQSLDLGTGKNLAVLGSNVGEILPSELSSPILDAFNTLGGSVLKLQEAYLTMASLDTDTSTSTNVFCIEVQWKTAEWELIHDFLTLESPSLKAYLTTTANSKTTAIYLSGTINFGKVGSEIRLDVTLLLPAMNLTGSLTPPAPGTTPTYSLAPLLSKFGFSSSHFNSISLNKFKFSADIRSRIFNLNIGLSSTIQFNINSNTHVTLSGVGLNLIHIGGNPSSNHVTVSGTCSINSQNYNVWVSHDTEGGGSFYGEASFAKPGLSLLSAVNHIISQFGLIGVTLPDSFTDAVKVTKISFQYDMGSKGFELKVEFAESMTIATLTGNKINPVIPLPSGALKDAKPTQVPCTTVSIKSSKIGNSRTTELVFKIIAGVQFSDFVHMAGDLPSGMNPILDEIDFSASFSSSDDLKSSSYIFSTTFSNGASTADKITFAGEYLSQTSTSHDTETSLFGGSMYSPTGTAIELHDPSFPINMGITDLFIAKESVTTDASSKSNKKTTSYTIFGADISAHAEFGLGGIPIVGNFLQEAKFDFEALRIVYAKSNDTSKKSISADKLQVINDYLNKIHIAPLQTAQSTVNNNDSKSADLPLGFSLQGNLIVGDGAKVIPLHSLIQQGGSNTSSSTEKVNLNDPDGANQASSHATPTAVGKKFGPVTLQDVNIGLDGGKLALTFTGGIQLGPLFLEFIGLEFKSPLSEFVPEVELSGFGINLSKPPLSVGGLFLKSELTDRNDSNQKIDVYNGSIAVGYKQYELIAMGSYAKLNNGTTSLFIYGFLGAPLGGLPAILMVTGAAAGFGYNRSFNLPLPEDVQSFPLIQPVVNPGAPLDFEAMNTSFAPQEGAFWGAIGIRIEAFKMIEAFLLLDVKFDHELEIDIIGLATMKFPAPKKVGTNKPNLANIIVGVVARIRPDQGLITVNGAFERGSYIYCPEAHLTGGFAMLSVLKDQHGGEYDKALEGDFVFTMGGYAPTYSKPPYYPDVPRVELNWNVNSNLSVKGQFYFAMTPNAMMAGGSISGIFQEGGFLAINVTFNIGADFIIYWQPYHYSAHFYADLHVTASVSLDLWLFTIHASVDLDLNADLKIWGPSFSGYGTVSIHVLFTFSASISFGENQETLPALGWQEFSDRLLPAGGDILSTNISKGTVASHSSDSYTAVNAKDLSIVCGSAIPIKTVVGAPGVPSPKTIFGIKAMGNTVTDFSVSNFTISIKRGVTDVSRDFTYTAITKNLPSSLWLAAPDTHPGTVPLNNVEAVITGLTTGVSIAVKCGTPASPFPILKSNEEIAKTSTANWSTAYNYQTGWSRGSTN